MRKRITMSERIIEIDGKQYEINIEKAAKDGYLKEIPHFPLKTGDVYVSKGYSSVLLIKPFYYSDSYILVGYLGLQAFSNQELQKVLSKAEVIDYLTINKNKFSHNINNAVFELI